MRIDGDWQRKALSSAFLEAAIFNLSCVCHGILFINILSMSKLKCKDNQLLVIDHSNHPVIAVSVSPKAFLLSFKFFTKGSRVFRSVQISIHLDQDYSSLPAINSFKILKKRSCYF